MLSIITHYRARPGCADQVVAVLALHQAASSAEPGCLRFDGRVATA